SRSERLLQARAHYDVFLLSVTMGAWAGHTRERGHMWRLAGRIVRVWRGWAAVHRCVAGSKQGLRMRLRLIRLDRCISHMRAYTRVRRLLGTLNMARLLQTRHTGAALQICYTATQQTTQLVMTLAWQAWRRLATQRRRWKWLLYAHRRIETRHLLRTVLNAWAALPGLRSRRGTPAARGDGSSIGSACSGGGPAGATLSLHASLPFPVYDRLTDAIGRGQVPTEQLLQDMRDSGVIMQQTSRWALKRVAAVSGAVPEFQRCRRGGDGSGGSGGGSDYSGGSGQPSMALFTAIDNCDAQEVLALLRDGVDVNAVYERPPPPTAMAQQQGPPPPPPSPSLSLSLPADAAAAAATAGAAIAAKDRGGSVSGEDEDGFGAPRIRTGIDGFAEVWGTTPLHAAAAHLSGDFLPIIVLLLHSGASTTALDADGRTPLQVTSNPIIAAVLSEHAVRLAGRNGGVGEKAWGFVVCSAAIADASTAPLWRYVVVRTAQARLVALAPLLACDDDFVSD
ncbi:unnamed protein product, partial [Phaeothamnion confervicola]